MAMTFFSSLNSAIQIIVSSVLYKKDDSINISVKDNGIGFKKSKNFKKNKIGGVGIQNVDKRIKFYYGKKYGIFISKPNEGAEVIIKIPLNK